MSYGGQRGPNVSEFIANLNAIPSAQDMAQSQDNFNLDDDLAMFTNTQFFDFDLGQDADLQPTDYTRYDAQGGAGLTQSTDAKAFDLMQGDFAFPEFAFPQAPNAFPTGGVTPTLQTTTSSVYPPSSSAASPSSGLTSPLSGEKRKADSITDGQYSSGGGFEDASRAAAEEDKRRRNTAASARFRVKKKQREQALEKSAKEMSDKMSALENRINQLETENKWLKNLVMEKNGDEKDEIADLWKKYSESAAADSRKGDTRQDGVGTKA